MIGHEQETIQGGGDTAGGGRPLVTIITPSLDQGRFLPACLGSVARQGRADIEHIVMDGGSTDGSVGILEKFGDAITWESGPDGGQVRAINEGIRRASGGFVMWLNADDELLDGALDALLEKARANPGADAVYARARMIDEHGRTIRQYPTFALRREDLRRKCSICQPTVLIRRAALERVGLLNPALDICFDYELWLRLLASGRMVFLDREVAASRQHGATKTASRRLRALVEAGYLMRAHFGRPTWRWSGKWVVHRWTLGRWRFAAPIAGWWSALACGVRYRRRFDASRPPSANGRRLLAALETPPALEPGAPATGNDAPVIEVRAGARASAGAS